MNVTVSKYSPQQKSVWDDFVDAAKNGIFLFKRDYMDYHADRFPDASLLFFDKDLQLIALLPSTSNDGEVLSSHAGLTFGGVVSGDSMKVGLMLEVFDAMVAHASDAGFKRLIYKAIPHIYHRVPAEEDLYALFRNNARLFRRDVSSTIEMSKRLTFSKGRKWSIKQALKNGIEVGRSFDFETFIGIEEHVLESRHGTHPVHTAAELRLLATRFPDQIKLFAASREGEMLAGVVIYESAQVAHAQYIGATDAGRAAGATDLVINHLINDYYVDKKYFDFGISTEDAGRRLNAGLAENKQGFGGRAVVYDLYEIDL
ncbi:MAG TPA: GNAT family N-acetyltransferase [Pyrinomonadaceae bacterium]|nr:GNAT family N-acetyltransferase [Pyrinomonadaceae bacterium]